MRTGIIAAVIAYSFITARADDTLPRSGALHRGIDLDLLELGPLEAHSAGGTGYGVRLAVGGQYELGPHWAVRVPLVVGVAGAGDRSFDEIDIVPGIVYRFRSSAAARWIPYAGGGVKLGAWGAERPLLGQPLVVARTNPDLGDLFGDHHSTSGGGDPNFDVKAGAGVELWAGAEWRPRDWFALTVGLTWGLITVDRTLIQTVAETVMFRFSL